ncbi:SHOCT domain-containing protein [Embleya sp. NPDC008237]|uniref:SHOCT domain-containing protein n=1 Tax=Embleya sp. NPDC008237 TaxID=3363978 RepID=UPI0036F01489
MGLLPALTALPARHGGHMYEDDDGWEWVWGSILMLLLILVIVAAVWLLARGSSLGRTAPGPDSGGSSATEVLAQRYARGEIDTEEYRERLAVLTAWPNTPREGKSRGRDRPDSPSS